jgi:hypothetical protein
LVVRAPGAGAARLYVWLEREELPKLLAATPISSCASWTPHSTEDSPTRDAPMDLGSAPGGAERRVQLMFAEADPRECWPRIVEYGHRLDASGLGRVLFAAAFIPTRVGTDTYTDQLW